MIEDTNYYYLFANVTTSYQQIVIFSYLAILFAATIVSSIIALKLDRKNRVQIGVVPYKRQSTLVDVMQTQPDAGSILHRRRSSILLKNNIEEIQNAKNATCFSSIIKSHSLFKIFYNYSPNLSRLFRIWISFFIYLALPAAAGIYAKYKIEDVIGRNVFLLCSCVSPLGVRLCMKVIELAYYHLNKCFRIRLIRYSFMLVFNCIIMSMYGFIAYIYYRLWTDSNYVYLNQWLLLFIIQFIFHAFIFESLYIAISYFYVRSLFHKKLQQIRTVRLMQLATPYQQQTQTLNTIISGFDDQSPHTLLNNNRQQTNVLNVVSNNKNVAFMNRQAQLTLFAKTTTLDQMQLEDLEGNLNIVGENILIQKQETKSELILKEKRKIN